MKKQHKMVTSKSRFSGRIINIIKHQTIVVKASSTCLYIKASKPFKITPYNQGDFVLVESIKFHNFRHQSYGVYSITLEKVVITTLFRKGDK